MKKVKIRAMDGALFFFEKLKGKYFMKRRKIQKKIRRSLYIASMLIIIIIIIIITTTFVDKYRGENERERERDVPRLFLSRSPPFSLTLRRGGVASRRFRDEIAKLRLCAGGRIDVLFFYSAVY